MVLCNLMNKNRSSFRLSVRVICSTSSKYQSESEYPKTELSQKAQKNSLDADILDVLCKTKYEKKLTKYSRKSDVSLWERIMEYKSGYVEKTILLNEDTAKEIAQSIKVHTRGNKDTVFYDGEGGLCHIASHIDRMDIFKSVSVLEKDANLSALHKYAKDHYLNPQTPVYSVNLCAAAVENMKSFHYESPLIRHLPESSSMSEDVPSYSVVATASHGLIKYLNSRALFRDNPFGEFFSSRPEFFFIVPIRTYFHLCMSTHEPEPEIYKISEEAMRHKASELQRTDLYNLYHNVLFQALFDFCLVKILPRSSYYPWKKYDLSNEYTNQKPKPGRERAQMIYQANKDTLMMVYVRPKKPEDVDIGNPKYFSHFIFHLLRNKNNFLVEIFERWNNGWGRVIIECNFNLFTTVKDLEHQQILDLYKIMINLPDFQYSVFVSEAETANCEEIPCDIDDKEMENYRLMYDRKQADLRYEITDQTLNPRSLFSAAAMYDKRNHLLDDPIPLQEACIDYICDNITSLCTSVWTETGEPKLQFKEEEIFFHTELSEQLLVRLCEKKKLDDLTLTLFQGDSTRLRHVRLADASKLSVKGLKTLKGHKIVELEALGLTKATVTDLISCLGEWSLQNLRLLNVSNSTFMDSNKFCVVVALAKLRNLQVLNVSNTEFSKNSLELVVEDLPLLDTLDISQTKVNDISPLRKCKDRLKFLSLYGCKLPASTSEAVVSVLCELQQLVHLDLSDDKEDGQQFEVMSPGAKFKISALLQRTESLPKLHSLDISGKEEILIAELCPFVKCHSRLTYLGLVLTDTCKEEMFTDLSHEDFNQALAVSGFGSETQIIEALNRYLARPQYIQKTLYYLFKMTTGNHEPRIEMSLPRIDIIYKVLSCAREYPTVFPIQMAATACLFNLSKAELGTKIHPKILKEIVKTDLDAMETFPQHQQLQKNVLLTICSDRILQEVNFDKYRCARLVLDCLCSWGDPSMNRMSVAICSILAAKISTEETSELGSHASYMKKLLSIVRGRMQDNTLDITLKFTLSALWNLTDESPRTCKVFLDEEGMELFLDVLRAFPAEPTIETKVLGLLNNIAEVTWLRSSLLVDPFINILRELLESNSIEVSYFAAGIVAHLASDKPERWTVQGTAKYVMTGELWNVVSRWTYPSEEMVAYRSFKPFFPLLQPRQEEAVQLWAVWAIHHVCTKNPARYCGMLAAQGGHTVLLALVREPATHSTVANITEQILGTMVEHGFLAQEEFIRNRQIYTSF